MRKIFIASLGAIAAIGLSACSEKAQNQVDQASEAVGNDIERGVNNADDKIAIGAHKAGQAIDNAGNAISAAARDVGSDVKEGTADAKKHVGNAVEKAGKDIKN